MQAEPAPTVASFSRRWLAEYAATNRTQRGHDQAAQRFHDYMWPHLGEMPLADLKPADIRRLNATLEAQDVGLVTRRRVLEDVRCMLRYAVGEAEVLARSPWRSGKGGHLPVLPEAAPDPLNDLELAEVLRVAPDPWKPVLGLLSLTGLRWGELRSLRWKDVRESPYPHLVVSRSHDKGTKSGKVREVPLDPEGLAILEGLNRSGPLVVSLPETASWIRRYVIRSSWVKDFHVHRLRHTYATKYLERGGSIEVLQLLLGHSTVKLTERYGRLRPHAVAAEQARLASRNGVTPVMDGTQDGTVKVSEG